MTNDACDLDLATQNQDEVHVLTCNEGEKNKFEVCWKISRFLVTSGKSAVPSLRSAMP